MAVIDSRFRNGTFLVYPDSACDNWIEILRAQHVPFIVSPLHDKDADYDDKDGDMCLLPKKPHYHVAIVCDGNKPLSYFQDLSDLCSKNGKGVNAWKIQNLRSMLRYFCHLDNPEKYQYPVNEMRTYCGASLDSLMEMQGQELTNECKKMQMFIKQMRFTSFQEFTNYLCEHNYDDWYYIVNSQRTLYFANLLRDIHFNEKEKLKHED